MINMEYMTEEQFDSFGMNIMNIMDHNLKLITALTRQCEQQLDSMNTMLHMIE